MTRFQSAFRRPLALAAAAALVIQPLAATWSIVVVDTATGEVAVGTATCNPGQNIKAGVPVVVPGIGVGAAQCSGDSSAGRRKAIRQGLLAGLSPDEIMTTGSSEQNGIVNLLDSPATFTGSSCGAAKIGITGEVGTLKYAIQGNVLAGKKVVFDAETALLNAPGDLAEKLMAAMEAARDAGGDGRCSCSGAAPNSCGSPPPSFTHTAYNGYMGVARYADDIGGCGAQNGCAQGNYFLSINVISGPNKKPPIEWLREKFDAWKLTLVDRPDAFNTIVDVGASALPADGVARLPIAFHLFDYYGNPLTAGGAQVSLINDSGQPAVTVPGAVTDHGDGGYSLELVAGTNPGTDVWRIVVDDLTGNPVSLPTITVRVDPLAPLHLGFDEVSAAAGGWVPLTLNAAAGDFYRVLGSSSGTQPGAPFKGTVLPLNRDAFMTTVAIQSNAALFPNTHGFLDPAGRAEAAFAPTPGYLAPFVGTRLEWSALFRDAGGVFTAAPAQGFDVLP